MKETNPSLEWTGLLIHLWAEEHLFQCWTGKVPQSSSISTSPVGTFFLDVDHFFFKFLLNLLQYFCCLFFVCLALRHVGAQLPN